MPIKQSDLESKWYYRLLKVFVIILPLILLLLWFLRGSGFTCAVTTGPWLDSIPYIVVAIILYFVILRFIRWILFYLIFGGVEDDRKGSGESRASRPRVNPGTVVLIIIGVTLCAIAILAQLGYITLPKLSVSDVIRTPQPGPSCPATSKQTSTPCGTVKGGVGVSGVIVPDRCACPSDTTFASMDNITAGGPYKICTCK